MCKIWQTATEHKFVEICIFWLEENGAIKLSLHFLYNTSWLTIYKGIFFLYISRSYLQSVVSVINNIVFILEICHSFFLH